MTSCKVFSYPNNHINSVTFHLVCHQGAMTENKNEQGITHLVEHLCFRKAGALNQSQLYHFAESKGVNIFGKTGKNYTELSFTCRPEVFDDIAKLVANMWFELNYTTAELEIEKKVIFNEIAVGEPTNGEIVLSKVWSNALLDCDILGTKQTVHSIALEQVINHKKSMLSSNTSIIVAGNFSQDNLDVVQKEFVDKFVAVDEQPQAFVDQTNPDDKLVVVKDGYDYADIYYSLHTTIGNSKENYVTILALDVLLFRGHAGHVVEILRDRLGYIYEIDSRVEIVNGEVGWLIRMSCHKNDVVQVVECVETLLNNFVPSKDHLQYVKAFYCDNLPMLLDKPNIVCDCAVNSIVAINQIVTLQEFANECHKANTSLYKQLLSQLLANKHVYVFGNISRKTTKTLKNTIL